MIPLLVALSAVQFVLLILIAGVLYQMLQQQGRLLTRMEDLEELLPEAGAPAGAHERPRGIPVAMKVPPFELADINGEVVRSEDLEGRRALLVNWSTTCSFCEQVVEELAHLQPSLESRRTDIVLVSRGNAEANRAFTEARGVTCRILLQPDGEEQIAAFARLGTPAGYLLDEHGRVAKPLALGSSEVLNLAREAAGRTLKLQNQRPVTESRLQRDGLEPGTQAPQFELNTVSGGLISLEDYEGRPLLLVFSDPKCGPCDELAPRLRHWYTDKGKDGPDVIMISRGDVEANRAKVAEYNLPFPVAIQHHWRTSKDYGTFSTPAAFLIDEEGVIASRVARGPDGIMALAQAALTERRSVPTA